MAPLHAGHVTMAEIPFSSADSHFTYSVHRLSLRMKLVPQAALPPDQRQVWAASLPQGMPETGRAAFCSPSALGHPESPYTSSGPLFHPRVSNSFLSKIQFRKVTYFYNLYSISFKVNMASWVPMELCILLIYRIWPCIMHTDVFWPKLSGNKNLSF